MAGVWTLTEYPPSDAVPVYVAMTVAPSVSGVRDDGQIPLTASLPRASLKENIHSPLSLILPSWENTGSSPLSYL